MDHPVMSSLMIPWCAGYHGILGGLDVSHGNGLPFDLLDNFPRECLSAMADQSH